MLRSRIVLMASEGIANRAIANTLDTSRPTVQHWRMRFAEGGLKSLTEIENGAVGGRRFAGQRGRYHRGHLRAFRPVRASGLKRLP